jgi:membrane protease YdiL (CAAX protease family)
MIKEEYYPSIKSSIGMLIFNELLGPIIPYGIIFVASTFITFSKDDPLVSAIFSISQVFILIVWIRRRHTVNFKEIFSLDKVSAIYLLPMTLMITGSGILLSEVDNIMREILPMSDFWIKAFNDLLGNNFAIWKGFIAVAVVAPITEEIIFRGIILRGFLKHYSIKKSIIVSALIFGLIHMNPWQFVSASIGGLILGWWYVKTNSIVLTIFGHALNNSISYFVSFIGLEIAGFSSSSNALQHQPAWFNLLGMTLAIAGMLWLNKMFINKEDKLESTSLVLENNGD